MKKRIINNIIEIEWGYPVETTKFEGDDSWGFDQYENVCSMLLTLSGKGETGSNKLNSNDLKLPDISSVLNTNIKFSYLESKRQYFFDDKILFDYRVNAEKIDLTQLGLGRLNNNTITFFNNKELKFLLILDVLSFDFYFNSPKEKPLKLFLLNSLLRNQIWDFYIKSCLFQYDCQLEEYQNAIRTGKELLRKENLPESVYEFIKTNITFWEEIIKDEF